jgi:hypothetical protein
MIKIMPISLKSEVFHKPQYFCGKPGKPLAACIAGQLDRLFQSGFQQTVSRFSITKFAMGGGTLYR